MFGGNGWRRPIDESPAVSYGVDGVAMAWFARAGQRIYYEDRGQGDAVVMMPGWAGSIIELNRLRHELAAGFRVIAVDLPGCGRSQPQPRRYEPDFYLRDARLLLHLYEELGIDAAHLVGFSDGGEYALLMAALAPGRALSLVTWGAAGQVVADPDGFESLMDDPSDSLKPLAAYLAAAYGVGNAAVMAASWAQALRAVITAGGDLSRSRASHIRCPALLLTGTHDPYCPPSVVREMAEAIPAGRFVEASGAGHDIHRFDPDWLAATVADWVGGH